jgi:hypothetical protein
LEARFSRKTVLAAIDVISVQRSFTHAALSALVIDLGQEVFAAVRSDVDASLAKRCNDLKTFVDANPEYEVEGVLSARCLGQTFLKNGMTRSRIGEVASDDHRSIRCTICLRRESPQQISTSRSSTLTTIRALGVRQTSGWAQSCCEILDFRTKEAAQRAPLPRSAFTSTHDG